MPLIREKVANVLRRLRRLAHVYGAAPQFVLASATIANPGPRRGPYDARPYQSTHNTGGAVMGTSPHNSAVNRYLQSWDVPNLFVVGASALPSRLSI